MSMENKAQKRASFKERYRMMAASTFGLEAALDTISDKSLIPNHEMVVPKSSSNFELKVNAEMVSANHRTAGMVLTYLAHMSALVGEYEYAPARATAEREIKGILEECFNSDLIEKKQALNIIYWLSLERYNVNITEVYLPAYQPNESGP